MASKRADGANSTQLPKPYVWAPTGKWDGNDGRWSSFMLNIGADNDQDGQKFRVLISTSSPLTIVPETNPSWCSNDCPAKRGVETFKGQTVDGFQSDKSKHWNFNGQYGLPLPYWWEKSLFDGAKPNGTFGEDNVGLGQNPKTDPIMPAQWVAQSRARDIFMGSFGMAVGDVDPGSGPKTPFLPNFNKSNEIPSLSYSYTAGAYYKNNGRDSFGSLILGGYDQSKIKNQRASISMPEGTNNTLVVGVQSLLYRPDPNVQASSTAWAIGGFDAVIDSTLPYFWLPRSICDKFEEAFQLKYDNETDMYLVDETAHRHNTQQKATMSFKIGQKRDNSFGTVEIELPYDAFDLEASAPFFSNNTKYFPIKRSTNGINVLGRTFLQEAYLIVDYERRNFTVAQVAWQDPKPSPTIIPILSTDFQPLTGPPPPPKAGGGLAPGAIAGIVVGILAAFGLLALGVFLWWRKRRQTRRASEKTETYSEIDTTQAGNQIKTRRVSELDSEPPGSPKSTLVGYYDPNSTKDRIPFPGINEMESPPAELYSPPPESATVTPGSERADYFIAGTKMRRRGATRESSGNNTPGTPGIGPIAELPGDDGKYTVDGQHFEPVASPTLSPVSPATPVQQHSRGPSDTTLATNIDEVLAGAGEQTQSQTQNLNPSQERTSVEGTTTSTKRETSPSPGVSPAPPLLSTDAERHREASPGVSPEPPQLERRSSHARGSSDTTVKSDSTGVSNPSPEDLEAWKKQGNEPRRPLSE